MNTLVIYVIFQILFTFIVFIYFILFIKPISLLMLKLSLYISSTLSVFYVFNYKN